MGIKLSGAGKPMLYAGMFLNAQHHIILQRYFAGVAKLVDARGLGPRGASRGGSSPFARTNCLNSSGTLAQEQGTWRALFHAT